MKVIPEPVVLFLRWYSYVLYCAEGKELDIEYCLNVYNNSRKTNISLETAKKLLALL